MESVWPVSKLSTESVGSRRQLVVIVFSPPAPTRQNSFVALYTADATKLDSFVASAVCIGLKSRRVFSDDTLQFAKFKESTTDMRNYKSDTIICCHNCFKIRVTYCTSSSHIYSWSHGFLYQDYLKMRHRYRCQNDTNWESGTQTV